MKYNKEIKNYCIEQLEQFSIPKFSELLSNAIEELSQDGFAMSNKNQILFFTKCLFYIEELSKQRI